MLRSSLDNSGTAAISDDEKHLERIAEMMRIHDEQEKHLQKTIRELTAENKKLKSGVRTGSSSMSYRKPIADDDSFDL